MGDGLMTQFMGWLFQPAPQRESEADAYLRGYNDTLHQKGTPARERRVRDIEQQYGAGRENAERLADAENHTVGGVCGHCSEAGHSTGQCPNKES